jgi:VWFA-related protein
VRLRIPSALLALLAAGSLSAQTPAPTPPRQRPTFRSGVNVVPVDVVVLDRTGHPVHALTKDDFEILDGGKPQVIATFSEIAHEHHPEQVFPETVSIDVADNRSARSDRLVVLLLDDYRIGQQRTEDVKQLARQIIAEVGPRASMALVTTSGSVGVEVTEDRSQLLRALDGFKANEAPDRARFSPGSIGALPSGGGASPAGVPADLQSFFNDQNVLHTMRDVAKALRGQDDRRKAVIWISSGIPASLSPDLKDLSGGATAPTPTESTNDYYAASAARLLSALHAANITTYAIDPAGAQPLGAYGFVDNGDLTLPLPHDRDIGSMQQQSLRFISEESGGFAITNTDDFRSGLVRLVNDLDNYYMLGFNPSDAKQGGYRRLTVRVKRPGLVIRYRRGYRMEDIQDAARRAAALTAGVLPRTDLPLRLFAMALPPSGKRTPVALTLEVTSPVSPLSDHEGRLADTIKYTIVTVDLRRKKATAVVTREAHLALRPHAPGGAAPDHFAYEIVTPIDMTPGSYQLRVGATSTRLGVAGSAYLPIEVPDTSKLALALSGPALFARGTPPIPSARGKGDGVSLLPFDPTLDRDFPRSAELEVFCGVAHQKPDVTATVMVEDIAGRPLWSRTQRITAASTLNTIVPLAGLTPGAYLLDIAVTDGTHSVDRRIGFTVR